MQQQSDFLRQFFKNISKRISRPYSAVADMEQELRKNWYDTPQSISSITDDQFAKMNIPMRVVSAIREELSSLGGEKPKQETQPQPLKSQIIPQKHQKKETESKKNQLSEGKILLLVQNLQNKVMEKYPWVGPQLLQIFETLYKIIKNIVSDSYELKFRVLKKSNAKIQKVIMNNEPVLSFLKQIGFEEDEEKVFLDTFDTTSYFFIEECLEEVANNQKMQNKQQNQHFNNVQSKVEQEPLFLPKDLVLPSSQEGVSLQGQFPKEKMEEANYAQMLEKLQNFRKKLMSSPPTNRHIRIYHKKYDVREVEHVVIDMDAQMDRIQNKMLAGYWKQAIKDNQKKAKFQSKRKMEFQFLISQQVYRQTTIKLKLPNELIVQARFGPLQTLQEVFNVVANIIIGQFYIYQAPPVKKLAKEMHRTLDSFDSVPSGSFFVGVNTQWYINNQFAKIIRF